MIFERIAVGFKLLWIALKAKMMHPEKRRLYLELLHFNTDLDENMTPAEKMAFHNWLDKVEEACGDK